MSIPVGPELYTRVVYQIEFYDDEHWLESRYNATFTNLDEAWQALKQRRAKSLQKVRLVKKTTVVELILE